MSQNKAKTKTTLFKTLRSAPSHLGCGCSGTQSISNVHSPKPKPKPKPKPMLTPDPQPIPESTSSSTSTTTTTTTFSQPECCSDEPGPSWPKEEDKQITATATKKTSSVVAVETETEDPYGEFRRSMLQMIFEKEIFSAEDLQHLLRCFLRLNSPAHHDVILRAFFDVCNAVVSSAFPPPPSTSSPPRPATPTNSK